VYRPYSSGGGLRVCVDAKKGENLDGVGCERMRNSRKREAFKEEIAKTDKVECKLAFESSKRLLL